MYGKEVRQKQLEERILKLLSKLKDIEEQLDSEDDINKRATLEGQRDRAIGRWEKYEDELKSLNVSDEITKSVSTGTKEGNLKKDRPQGRRPQGQSRMSPDVAAALVQLAKAWVDDQDSETE